MMYRVKQRIETFCYKKKTRTAFVEAPEGTPDHLIKQAGLEQIEWSVAISQSWVYVSEVDAARVTVKDLLGELSVEEVVDIIGSDRALSEGVVPNEGGSVEGSVPV